MAYIGCGCVFALTPTLGGPIPLIRAAGVFSHKDESAVGKLFELIGAFVIWLVSSVFWTLVYLILLGAFGFSVYFFVQGGTPEFRIACLLTAVLSLGLCVLITMLGELLNITRRLSAPSMPPSAERARGEKASPLSSGEWSI